MKKVSKGLRWLYPLLLAGWASTASAQSVWTYEVINADNTVTIGSKPPMDISYPPGGARAPVYFPHEMPRGTLMTPQEAAARQNAPKLIILLGPIIR